MDKIDAVLREDEGSIDPILVSVKQAAKALDISPWLTYQLCDRGELESVYIGRSRKVVLASLRRYVANLPTVPSKDEASA